MKLTAKPRRLDSKLKKVSPANMLRYQGRSSVTEPSLLKPKQQPKQRLSRVDRAVALANYFCDVAEQKRKAKEQV